MAPKNGKRYPRAAELEAYGFSKSGMLIVDGGTININGTFAGIIQTKGTGTINATNATSLSVQGVREGTNRTGAKNCNNNKTTFDLVAKIYDLNKFVNLGNYVYKAFSNDSFVFGSYNHKTYTDADLNPKMQAEIIIVLKLSIQLF